MKLSTFAAMCAAATWTLSTTVTCSRTSKIIFYFYSLAQNRSRYSETEEKLCASNGDPAGLGSIDKYLYLKHALASLYI